MAPVFILTPQEEKAMAALEALAKKWPANLWLYSASGKLHVMRLGEDGKHAQTEDGGTDANYSVGTINIPNDGGDW